MSAQIRHILDDANMDDEDIMRIMSIVEKQEEKFQERVNIMNGVKVSMEEMFDRIAELEIENETLKEENEELKKERDEFKIDMIKHTRQNYDVWRKEMEALID